MFYFGLGRVIILVFPDLSIFFWVTTTRMRPLAKVTQLSYTRLIMIRICFAFILVAFFGQVTVGQEPEADWRDHIIPVKERTFDFKTVPKGAIPEHRFTLVNPFQEPIRIVAITSSCVCTTIDFDEQNPIVLQTYEKTDIPVRLRADMFDGLRNATITVSLDQPNRSAIQLNIRGEIRKDLNISPNFLDFGTLELGKGLTRSLIVTYTGTNTQWRIADIKCENELIRAEIIADPAMVGRKVFKVNVFLDKSAPNGMINCHLILVSNDAQNRQEIPIPVRAKIGTAIDVSPPAVSFGVLPPGRKSQPKEAVISGSKPFRITKIECDNPVVEVTLKNSLDIQSRLHKLSISYLNPMEGEGAPQNGIMRATIKITTDVPGLTLTFYATANIREEENRD